MSAAGAAALPNDSLALKSPEPRRGRKRTATDAGISNDLAEGSASKVVHLHASAGQSAGAAARQQQRQQKQRSPTKAAISALLSELRSAACAEAAEKDAASLSAEDLTAEESSAAEIMMGTSGTAAAAGINNALENVDKEAMMVQEDDVETREANENV